MGRLDSEADSERRADRAEGGAKDVTGRRRSLAKWLIGPCAAAAVAATAANCTVDNYVPQQQNQPGGGTTTDGGSTTDGGTVQDGEVDADSDADAGCQAPAPVCSVQEVTGLLNVGGDALIIGDFSAVLSGTDEQESEQRAIVSLLDSCGVALFPDHAIDEGSSITLDAAAGIKVVISAANVTVSDPKSARISARMECAELDGGIEEDGGTSDGGADAGPGVDGGELDGGPDEDGGAGDGGADAGPGVDGGGLDGGPVEDGGIEEDGGVSDGGSGDAGAVCAEASEGEFSGLIFAGTPQIVGGYVFEYLGINAAGDAIFDITCGGLNRYDSQAFPEDVVTTLTTVDGKRIVVTPHTNREAKTDISIVVENAP